MSCILQPVLLTSDMDLLKALIVDIVVTAVILIAVATEAAWARWAVIIYTPFMLLLKVFALLGGSLVRRFDKKVPDAPTWAYHLLYAVNVAALAIAGWWLLAAAWAAIWIISYVEFRKSQPAS